MQGTPAVVQPTRRLWATITTIKAIITTCARATTASPAARPSPVAGVGVAPVFAS